MLYRYYYHLLYDIIPLKFIDAISNYSIKNLKTGENLFGTK